MTLREVTEVRSKLKIVQRKMQSLWDGWHRWDGAFEMERLAESFREDFELLEVEERRLLNLLRGR